jgi:hypothetical protein
VKELGGKLTPGDHVVSAELVEGDRTVRTPPVRVRIRGDPAGGGGESERPDPGSGGGSSRLPEPDALRFVRPLFRPGATVAKEGWALVPDPEAPPGAAPRRLPLEEAAREAGRRAEEEKVLTERVAERDRPLVIRYFERLREGR